MEGTIPMWSGGVQNIENKEDLAAARKELVDLQQDMSDATQQSTDAGNAVSDARTELDEVRGDESKARGDESRLSNEARSKHEAAKNAADSADSYRKNAELELKKLEPQERSVAEQFRLARFQKEMYIQETMRMFFKGMGEFFAEQQNRDGEIWRFIHAAFAKMGRAMISDLVGQLSASTMLDFKSYYQPASPPHDSSEQTYANAYASHNSLEAEKANKIENLNDPYYANKAAEKAAEASQANAEHSQAATDYAAAQSAANAAETGYLSAREAYNDAESAKSDVATEINEARAGVEIYGDKVQAKIYKKQLENG